MPLTFADEEPRGPEQRAQRPLDPLELGVGGELRPGRRGALDARQRRLSHLVGVEQHRLRQVDRRLLGRGRNSRQVVAAVDLLVGQPAALVAEDDRRRALRGALDRLPRELFGREPALAAHLARARPDHPGAVGDRLVEARNDLRLVEQLLGVHRHPARRAEVQGARVDDGPVAEAEVLQRPRRRPEVLGVARAQQHESNGDGEHFQARILASRMRARLFSRLAAWLPRALGYSPL